MEKNWFAKTNETKRDYSFRFAVVKIHNLLFRRVRGL